MLSSEKHSFLSGGKLEDNFKLIYLIQKKNCLFLAKENSFLDLWVS